MNDAVAKQSNGPSLAVLGFLICGAALLATVAHLLGGPLAPQQEVSVTLGDMAAEIGKSAARNALGMEQPAPQTVPWDIDRSLKVGTIVAAVLGVLLATWSLVHGQHQRLAVAAIAAGTAATLLQIFAWALFAILGVLLICSLLAMIGAWLPFG